MAGMRKPFSRRVAAAASAALSLPRMRGMMGLGCWGFRLSMFLKSCLRSVPPSGERMMAREVVAAAASAGGGAVV